MNDEIKNLLESVRRGEMSVDEAYLKLRTAPFRDLGFAKIDTHRRLRTGAAEVIYGAGKTPEQMLEIIKAMLESRQETILITRLEKHAAEILSREFALNYCEIAKIGSIGSIPEPRSVGYGAAFGGVAALLSMLNSCSSGVSVVNIDNGFGAGYLANMINHIGTGSNAR